MIRAGLIVAAGVLLAPAAHAGEDSLCKALGAYAKAIPAKGAKSVTVKTDWGGEPTIACGRDKDAASERLCKRLVETLSIESMTINVRRVMRCMGTPIPGDSEADPWAPLEGTVTTDQPAFTWRPMVVAMTYDSSQRGAVLPFFTLTFTPH